MFAKRQRKGASITCQNARLTPFGRERLVKQVLERVNARAASRRAFPERLQVAVRFRNEGLAGFAIALATKRALA